MTFRGIYTGRGNRIPPAPNVTNEVEEWSNLIRDLRDLRYTVPMVRELVKADQERKADEIANGTTGGHDALAGD